MVEPDAHQRAHHRMSTKAVTSANAAEVITTSWSFGAVTPQDSRGSTALGETQVKGSPIDLDLGPDLPHPGPMVLVMICS
jgi:hypothetical protein